MRPATDAPCKIHQRIRAQALTWSDITITRVPRLPEQPTAHIFAEDKLILWRETT